MQVSNFADARQGTEITAIRADITTLTADVLINAANSTLSGGGGVDGAIHAAAGPSLMTECQRIFRDSGPCQTGSAIMTSAGQLDASWIVHTVGPIWSSHEPAESARLLSSCYRSSLDLAAKVHARTAAFSSISTGVYGFPKERAAPIAVSAVEGWLQNNLDTHILTTVTLVCFDEENFALTNEALDALDRYGR